MMKNLAAELASLDFARDALSVVEGRRTQKQVQILRALCELRVLSG
jgi:hypothetical protein